MKTVRNTLTATEYSGRVMDKLSLTVPDQTMTMRTMLEKYVRGISFDVGADPIFDEDGDAMGINIKTLDLTEIAEMAENNRRIIEENNENFTTHKKSKAKADFESKVKAAAQEISSQTNPKGTNNPLD